ncbi:Uncharacterized protein FWK35_00037387, partial [Aphis craccivora]
LHNNGRYGDLKVLVINILNSLTPNLNKWSEYNKYHIYFYKIICRNNASISNFGGGFRWKIESSWCIGEVIFEIPNSFQKCREKPKKKLRKNGNLYAKPVFDQIDFFICCNSKTNHCKYSKISPNLYNT